MQHRAYRILLFLVALTGVSLLSAAHQARTAPSAVTPILVAEFDFDDDFGAADPQGWRPLVTFAKEEAFFHVEDFSGAGHEAFALEGSRSMWIGLDAEDPRTCSWAAPPGYGNSWAQNLTSTEFAVQGDVHLDFLMDMDIEPTYEFVYVQYENSPGSWMTLDTYSCGDFTLGTDPCGPVFKSYVVPALAHDGNVRFRFFFTSDGGISAADPIFPLFHKAFVLDSLTVSDNTGLVDYQDFESEAVDDSVTTDGHWYAEVNQDALNAGGLVDGSVTLQESVVQNDTHFWAFLEGSTTDYGCAGYPGQATTPVVSNVVRSPRIDVTHDINGNPVAGVPDSIAVAFDVYRDVDPNGYKSYTFQALTYEANCLVSATSVKPFQGDQKDWYRQRIVFAVPPGTEEIEINLGIRNSFLAGCVSHAPLLDNVTVERINEPATGVGGGPSVLVLGQNRPNPFNPGTTI